MVSKKQETAVKSAVTREKKRGIVREEKHMLWILLAIIALLLYLLMAQGYGWWPFVQERLGSAFYTNIPAASSSATPTKNSSSTSGSSTSGTNGNNGSSGTNSNGNSGGSTTPPSGSGSSSITDLAASVNVGDTKTKISGQANKLGSGCAVVVKASAQVGGKQEVCTYSQGDKIVTVTYLNDRVISASKSGF